MFAPVGDDAFAEAGTPDCGYLGRYFFRADEQKAVELTGEGVLGSVLVGGGGAHRHQAAVRAQLGQGLPQLGLHFRGGLKLFDDSAVGCVLFR